MKSIHQVPLSTVVLAGGSSSRMGTDKRMLELGGKTLIERVLLLATKVSDDILISTNDAIPGVTGFRTIPDNIPGAGPLGGLVSAMPHARYPFILLLSCDMPFVNEEMVRFLLEEITENQITLYSSHRVVQPMPGIYPLNFLPGFKTSFQQGIRSLQKVLEKNPVKIIPTPPSIQKTFFLNINRENDYFEARKLFEKKA